MSAATARGRSPSPESPSCRIAGKACERAALTTRNSRQQGVSRPTPPSPAACTRAAQPTKEVVLATGDTHFLDNSLDLFPDDPQQIGVRGLGDAEITVEWLHG